MPLRMMTSQWLFDLVLLLVFALSIIQYTKLVHGVGEGTVKTGCKENERKALLEFKQGLVDDYGILSSWGSEEDKKDCCKWRGIKCSNRTGHIIILDLQNRDQRRQPFGPDQFYNPLRGEVPDCWIHTKELEILDLANNHFSGKLPTSFGFLCQLQLLSLHNNNFMGEVPSSLKNCRLLEVIDLSENKLSGQVPAWIGTHLTSLVVLSFRRNEFRGSIPPSLCHLNRTQVLDLSQNNISRNIPSCLNKLTSLVQTSSSSGTVSFLRPGGVISHSNGQAYIYYTEKYVAGASVQWKGKLLEYKNTLRLLKCIDLSSNKLVGKIPQELASLEGLVSLNLSRNNLTGGIVQNVSQMKMLEILDLSENQLSGEIPTGLASLNFLSVLDLSRNNFSGKIPSSTQLQSFNASVYAGNSELCGLPLPNKCPVMNRLQFLPLLVMARTRQMKKKMRIDL